MDLYADLVAAVSSLSHGVHGVVWRFLLFASYSVFFYCYVLYGEIVLLRD